MFRRLIETRLHGARRVANQLVDGLDDRSKLFVLELAEEQKRLTGLVIVAFAAVVVSIVAIVWGAATLVAFSWDTPWRNSVLLGLLAFWGLFALVLIIRVRHLLASGSDAFQLSRRVASDDFERVREALRQ